MTERSIPPHQGRVMLPLFLRLAPAIMAMAALLALEMGIEIPSKQATRMTPMPTPDVPTSRESPPSVSPGRGNTRLIVIWIDSMDQRDIEAPDRLPRLRARMQAGLHGPVRTCNDAMTIPCFTAMQIGVDRFSLFSIFSNFGGTVGLEQGSIIRTMQADGARTGYIGDKIVAPAAKGMDWWRPSDDSDITRIDEGIAALDEHDLDFIIIHLTGVDEIAHRHGDAHPSYAANLRELDTRIDAVFGQLRPTDHVMILGDHGHLLNGVHSPGMEVPTYAIVLGPMFDRPLYRPMVVTEFGALWGAMFGFDFGHIEWLQQYLHGTTPAPITELPRPPLVPSNLAWWASLLATVLALLCAAPLSRGSWRHWFHYRRAASFLAVASAGFVAGVYYTRLRPYVHWQPGWFDVGFAFACCALGAMLLIPVLPRARWHHRMLGGALFMALPSVYSHGGPRIAIAGLITVTGVGCVRALRQRDLRAAGLYALIAGVAVSVWFPNVSNFVIRSFPHYQLPFVVALAATLCFVGFACALAAGPQISRKLWYTACGVGLALASVVVLTPARLWLVPCVMAFPLMVFALWRPRFEPLAAVVTLPSMVFLHQGDMRFLLPAAAMLACWVAWAHLSRREDAQGTPAWVHGLVFVLLIWLGYWAIAAVRASGYDFTYFFRWLSEGGDVEETWYLNTPLTIVKYSLHSMLGILLYRRVAPRAFARRFAWARDFIQVKLSVVLFIIIGFASMGTMGTFLAADVLQEGALWSAIVLLFAWVLPLGIPVTRVANTA